MSKGKKLPRAALYYAPRGTRFAELRVSYLQARNVPQQVSFLLSAEAEFPPQLGEVPVTLMLSALHLPPEQ
jgi:hypothetical protein